MPSVVDGPTQTVSQDELLLPAVCRRNHAWGTLTKSRSFTVTVRGSFTLAPDCQGSEGLPQLGAPLEQQPPPLNHISTPKSLAATRCSLLAAPCLLIVLLMLPRRG